MAGECHESVLPTGGKNRETTHSFRAVSRRYTTGGFEILLQNHMNFQSEPGFFDRVDGAEEINLRGFQDESVQLVRANFKEPDVSAQILSIPTGGGKTTIGAYLLKQCWQKERRGMFVVDRISLLGQTSRTLDRYGIPHGVIQSGHPRYMPGELIQVASIHTLARRGWPAPTDLIVADEIHVLYRTMTLKMEKRDAKILGLTATPFTRGLGKHFQRMVNVTTTNRLIAEGVLCPFKIWASKEPDMTGVPLTKFGEWEEEATSKRAVRIVGDVVKEYLDKGDGGKAIAFGVDVAHCEAMQAQFIAAGINAQLYTYLTIDEEREYLIGERGEFRKPDSSVRVLISVAALSRGFDVPDVSVILMCRPLRNSFMELIQVIGRGLRASPGKDFCRLLDMAGNFSRHYPAMVEFFEEGAQALDDGKPKPKKPKLTEEKKPRKCPKCSYLPIPGDYCPACGHLCKRISSVKHEEGSLASFDGTKTLALDRIAKMNLYAELRFICADRNYNRGWAAHKYRAITGVWPRGMDDITPYPPRRETLDAVERLARKFTGKVIAGRIAQRKALAATPNELDLFA